MWAKGQGNMIYLDVCDDLGNLSFVNSGEIGKHGGGESGEMFAN